jgi:hypothetical protein
VALAAVVAVVSGAVALNSDAYDAARWRAGQVAVNAGLAPATVDAGFEWVGSHAAALAVRGRRVAGAPPYETWYDEMFRGFRDCAFVSGSQWQAANLRLLRTTTYQEVGFAGPERLYLYAVRSPGCPDG